ncbi:MAG TPA: histidinol-phosphate transaminase [Verrucomicrobiota bacterium]|nr:histidinol-phosphate transaminase [Verrucomicrobiota bacterium]HNU52729.1 histidinol-phosphate transaminase [Verrucomicrobiota bacterium]
MRLIRPLVETLHAYVPGEQPKIRGLVKLNTNENPYPPSPRVLRALRAAIDGRLRLYPNPTSDALRERLAVLHGCTPDHIVVGNGSDEILALATRAFVEPASPTEKKPRSKTARPPGATLVQYFTPSYSLYPVLADIHGAVRNPVPLKPGFRLPTVTDLRRGGRWRFDAALTFVTTPSAPTGCGYPRAALEALCANQRGVVVLDEAYVDFAAENALALALRYPNVLVARTFSKAYSLCFQRVGYAVASPDLVAALHKIKDSYNVNGLGQVAALASLDDLDYYRANFARVRATRGWLSERLGALGFDVTPSQTNFIFCRPPHFPAEDWFRQLRERRVLVRWFGARDVRDYLRITVGTPAEAKALLRAVRTILRR